MNSSSEIDFKSRIIDLLTRLGASVLSEYIGSEKLERFHQSGQSLDSYSLAEILYTENGINIFRNKNLRKELLASFGAENLKKVLNVDGSIIDALNTYNNFNFGENSQSKGFLKLLGLPSDGLFDKKVVLEPVEPIIVYKSLYGYQNWIRKSLNNFLKSDVKRKAIVHMPTGSGKTRTMLEAVCDHIRSQENTRITIVWLAHSEELCEQSIESFKELWGKLGTEDALVVRLWGGAKPQKLDIVRVTFVVASFQTAYKMLSTNSDEQFSIYSNIKSKCTLLVVDEAHQSTASTYKEVIQLFSNHKTKIVGLTATPGRHHVGGDAVETAELSNFYENNKINILDDDGKELSDPIGFLTKKGILAKVYRFQIKGAEIELSESEIRHMERLLDVPRSVLDRLGKDAKRTNLIVTHAIKLAIEEDMPTIIFAPSKENAIEIATLLKLKDVSAAAITSDTQKFERRQIIGKFKLGDLPILVNFGVLTTGFDAPNIKAVIIARPTTSVVLYSQMIGRGLRGPMMGGEEDCYLVDVKDNLINMPKANQAFTYFDSYYK